MKKLCSSAYSDSSNLQDNDQVYRREQLRQYVKTLSTEIGERNCFRPSGLDRAALWIESEFKKGGYVVIRQPVTFDQTKFNCSVGRAHNIIAEFPGLKNPNDILVLGAHYDSKVATPRWSDHGPAIPDQAGTPGANDNGSGVAALLNIAANFAGKRFDKTLRFVAFVNEEPPFFQDSDAMGSYVFARDCRRKKESIVGAIILDALGVYSEQPNNKRKRFGILPCLIGLPNGNKYVAFLSNRSSRKFTKRCATEFNNIPSIELRTVSLPALMSKVAWSDDWSFWQHGYSAFTVTDTAYLRSDHYHELTDTMEELDYATLATVVQSIEGVLQALLGEEKVR